MLLLAWRPFLDPLPWHTAWWFALVPLALGISVTYKAVRLPTLDRFMSHVLVMTAQIVAAIVMLWIASYLLIQVVVPLITPLEP